MRPDKHGVVNGDLFRSSLEAILDMDHELVQLAGLISWDRFDDAFGQYYHESKGRRGLRTQLMVGLHLLKHMKGLSDEEACAAWRENPYFQFFCGESHFQHRLPFDRTSMTPLSAMLCIACRARHEVHQASNTMPPGREPRLRKISRDLAAAEERVSREHPINLMYTFKRLSTHANRRE